MFIENKYAKWYFDIVKRRQLSPAPVGEKHHIIPKSIGGTNQKNNIICLTAREHYICHRLLVRITTGIDRQKMWLALDCFTKSIQNRKGFKVNSHVIAESREQSKQYLRSIRKGNATRPAGTYKHSEETKQKQSDSARGIVKRPPGYSHSSDTIQLMRQNRKGKNLGTPSWNKGISQVCPHCNKKVGGTLNRWHGDNCQFKSVEE
jgi:hypothetical protein